MFWDHSLFSSLHIPTKNLIPLRNSFLVLKAGILSDTLTLRSMKYYKIRIFADSEPLPIRTASRRTGFRSQNRHWHHTLPRSGSQRPQNLLFAVTCWYRSRWYPFRVVNRLVCIPGGGVKIPPPQGRNLPIWDFIFSGFCQHFGGHLNRFDHIFFMFSHCYAAKNL